VLDSLQNTSLQEARSLRLFAHVLIAEQIYLDRMRGHDPWPQHFWPELTLQECVILEKANQIAYHQFLTELADEDIDLPIKYRNSKGLEFHTPVRDLLTHVALHGSYHRGQIAFVARTAGNEPVNTDFITFVREGNADVISRDFSIREEKINLQRLFQYTNWANQAVLQLLQSLNVQPDRALSLFSHVLAAELVWLTRLRGEDSSALAIWPEFSLQACTELARANASAYRSYLDQLSEEALYTIVTYRNSQGAEFHTAVADILTQVALHGAYHRSQIALTVRNAGHEPVNTDFITFVRESG
jgi:uncharacterized damage-inducible protein DinB